MPNVFHLQRSRDADAFRHEELEPSDVAARIASNLLEESSSPSPHLAAAGSCLRLDVVPEVETMYDQIRQTCTAALSNAACYSIAIPQQANATDVACYLHQQGLMQAVEPRFRTGLKPMTHFNGQS